MQVSIEWLREYVDCDMDLDELAERLSLSGTAVESLIRSSAAGQDDAIMELEITPNRPDCMGMIGVAREVAAIYGKRIRKSPVRLREINIHSRSVARVNVIASELCPRYAVRILQNVKIADSPAWLKRRLTAGGIRPINNAVDVTNYVMLESGQPLHAFDRERLVGESVTVRRAEPGEIIVTLDGVTRILTEHMLVIADANGAVALAGVMGGESSEVQNDTSVILLESANFDSRTVLQTARQLGLISESSLRFERGVDIGGVTWALDRGAQLIQEMCGGEILKDAIDVYPDPVGEAQISLRPKRLAKVLGCELSPEEIGEFLRPLGMRVSLATNASAVRDGSELQVMVPTFRVDVEREIDLIEEVARLYGYNKIPATLPPGRARTGYLTAPQKAERSVKEIMVAAGLSEIISFSFTNHEEMVAMKLPESNEGASLVMLRNPLSTDQSAMRSTLLPGLIGTAKFNIARGQGELRLFELGAVFSNREGELLPRERQMLAALVYGKPERHWLGRSDAADFFAIKGVVEFLARQLGMSGIRFVSESRPSFHPGRSARIEVDSDIVGYIGELHPDVQAKYEIPDRVGCFELDIGFLLPKIGRAKLFSDPSRYPPISLDIAVTVAQGTDSDQIIDAIREQGGDLLENVSLFDVYQGDPIPPDKKSLAFALIFRAQDRTLDWETIEAKRQDIIDHLRNEMQASVRT